MKKSELKNIIKECVREVIFEEGMLAGVVSEVVQGLGKPMIQETARPASPSPKPVSRSPKQRKRCLMLWALIHMRC
jgi:hypothetical protein